MTKSSSPLHKETLVADFSGTESNASSLADGHGMASSTLSTSGIKTLPTPTGGSQLGRRLLNPVSQMILKDLSCF